MTKMICLGIETSGSKLGLILCDMSKHWKVRACFFKKTGVRQSDILIPLLEKLLKTARRSKKDIRLIAVDVGPGSFTGVRVGVSAARALAQGLNVPLIGVTSLEAIAWAAQQKNPKRAVAVCVPALQDEVYFAGYKPGFRTHHAPCWKKEAEFENYVRTIPWSEPPLIVTDDPRVEAIVQVALLRYTGNPTDFPYEKVVPVYLQPSWAERTKHATSPR